MVYGPRPYGLRRLWTLVKFLSPTSALHRELSRDVKAGWSQDTHLLASLLEAYVNTHQKKGAMTYKIPRPNDRNPQQLSGAELEAVALDLGGVTIKRKKKKRVDTSQR